MLSSSCATVFAGFDVSEAAGRVVEDVDGRDEAADDDVFGAAITTFGPLTSASMAAS